MSMKKLEACDFNHLILYAKNWYKRGNEVEDVRKILAHRCGRETISDTLMWKSMVQAFTEYAKPWHVQDFMERMFKDSLGNFDPSCSLERAVGLVIGHLAGLEVKGEDGEVLLNLGEPDSNVLPLDDKGYYEGVKR